MTQQTVDQAIRRYQLDEDYTVKSYHLRGVEFANAWATIKDEVMTIKAGYAWDGCSPTYYLPIIGWIGVPDGTRDANGFPQAYHASLVHDVLCEFRQDIKIDQASTVDLFRDLLLQGGFSPRRADLYATVVRWLGPRDWPEPGPRLADIVTTS